MADIIQGSMHASAVIRALRTKRSSVVDSSNSTDIWDDDKGDKNFNSTTLNSATIRTNGITTGFKDTYNKQFEKINDKSSPHKEVDISDVHKLNDIVKENKNSTMTGGKTKGGVRYSASELQFYKDHISGVKAAAQVPTGQNNSQSIRIDQSTISSTSRTKDMSELPLWMRGSKASFELTGQSNQFPCDAAHASEVGISAQLNNADSESDEEDERYYAEKKWLRSQQKAKEASSQYHNKEKYDASSSFSSGQPLGDSRESGSTSNHHTLNLNRSTSKYQDGTVHQSVNSNQNFFSANTSSTRGRINDNKVNDDDDSDWSDDDAVQGPDTHMAPIFEDSFGVDEDEIAEMEAAMKAMMGQSNMMADQASLSSHYNKPSGSRSSDRQVYGSGGAQYKELDYEKQIALEEEQEFYQKMLASSNNTTQDHASPMDGKKHVNLKTSKMEIFAKGSIIGGDISNVKLANNHSYLSGARDGDFDDFDKYDDNDGENYFMSKRISPTRMKSQGGYTGHDSNENIWQDENAPKVEAPKPIKGRAGDVSDNGGFKALQVKPGQRLRVRPTARRTRN